MNQYNGINGITKYIRMPGDDEETEVLMIRRFWRGKPVGASVWIPIDNLWVFVEDKHQAYQAMQCYCDVMWGPGQWNVGELRTLARFIESRIDALLRTPPRRELTKNEIENMIERAGLRIEVDGEAIVDAAPRSRKVMH